MIEFMLGIAVGAAFAPMWIKVWEIVSSFGPVRNLIDKVKDTFTNFTK